MKLIGFDPHRGTVRCTDVPQSGPGARAMSRALVPALPCTSTFTVDAWMFVLLDPEVDNHGGY